ncbi:hypothetical protein RFM41_22000 [Mesorhizobium sp. VK25A]|uniref:Uncharacterized protein n=1 Tax=Mesorhizobium vachelliae TaxID=3072309 RepID=A0ABU5A9I2_9HYPH|nr:MULTISPECIES: hypothetical protein [unclassified Mesorhizobium]MDX8533842.1 hypothetical protein [Mesorhizobium sp. VK25D]MDX8546437.1 hypothetical protein [Mesorhizobium sp. VK25A]
MNKIVIFRGKNAVPAPGKAAAWPPAGARVLQFRPRPPRRASNAVVRAIWHRDSRTGRLECRWVPGHGAASENGARPGLVVERVVAGASSRRSPSLSR